MESDFKAAWAAHFEAERQKSPLTEEQAAEYEKYALANRERASESLENILRYLHLDLRGRRVLDVGSAYGGFSIVAAQKGAEAYGVEILDYLHRLGEANALNEPGNIKLINADILDRGISAELGAEPFDLIMLHDVFEHVYDSSALFRRIGDLSDVGTTVNFAIPNGDCWQAIEREAHRFMFGLTLLEPGAWSELTGSFNIYYRPLHYYQLFFQAIGFSHLYLMIDRQLVQTAVERVQLKFRELEQKVTAGPFASDHLNSLARHRFALLEHQLAEDIKEKNPLYIHLMYDHYVWQGFAAKNIVQPLEHAEDIVRLTYGTPVSVETEPSYTKPEKKRVVITIDVEASPYAQSEDHVDRLIWGKFGNEEVGIRRMMEVADRYGHKLTFFVDYCEVFRYPGRFEEISREITDRGHDLQLHAHMDLLPEEFWEKHNLKKYHISLSDVDRQRAGILLDFLQETAQKMGGGNKPVAFRGGSFRYNNVLLRQMKERGIDLSFNYNVLSQHQTNNSENLPLFKWNNGVFELPMANVYMNNWLRDLDFNDLNNFQFTDFVYAFIDKYYTIYPSNSVAVMIMHSWSFCYTEENTRFKIFRDNKLVDNFDRFLANLPQDIEIVTATDVHNLITAGELQTDIVRDVDLVDKYKFRSRIL